MMTPQEAKTELEDAIEAYRSIRDGYVQLAGLTCIAQSEREGALIEALRHDKCLKECYAALDKVNESLQLAAT